MNQYVRHVSLVAEDRNSVIVVGDCFVECLSPAELQVLANKSQQRLAELNLTPTEQSEADMAGVRG